MKHVLALLFLLFTAAQGVANPVATEAVNAMRASAGQGALLYVPALARAARNHVEDTAQRGFYDHRGSDGSDVGQRAHRAGYRWCWAAENIAWGQQSLGRVLSTWAASPGHAKNLLNRKARAFGIARGRGNIWVMVLAAPCRGAGERAVQVRRGVSR